MPCSSNLQLLVLSLPTSNTTARMRAWRSLKASGAAVLRDGVYALPQGSTAAEGLRAIADDVLAHGGTARLLEARLLDEPIEPLFDRSAEFAALLTDVQSHTDNGAEGVRATRRLRRAFEQLAAIDFFPGQAQGQAAAALQALEARLARQGPAGAVDEPRATPMGVPRVERGAYQGRLWATRARPWVDRLASAWLIRRHIDPAARFLWLADPKRLPKGAVGYDFDGATFSHVGVRVTFETLLAAFSLETPALLRLGTVVHALDAGGVMPAEASGVETVLAGMRDAIADDDALALAAAGVFEGLYLSFERELNKDRDG